MRTGLEGDIEGCPKGSITGLPQGDYLRMIFSGAEMVTLTQYLALFHQYGPYHGIGAGFALSPGCEEKGPLHKDSIGGHVSNENRRLS
jgi:hypothetical protein